MQIRVAIEHFAETRQIVALVDQVAGTAFRAASVSASA